MQPDLITAGLRRWSVWLTLQGFLTVLQPPREPVLPLVRMEVSEALRNQ